MRYKGNQGEHRERDYREDPEVGKAGIGKKEDWAKELEMLGGVSCMIEKMTCAG